MTLRQLRDASLRIASAVQTRALAIADDEWFAAQISYYEDQTQAEIEAIDASWHPQETITQPSGWLVG